MILEYRKEVIRHKEHKKSELLCANSYCHVKNFEGVTLK